MAANLVIKVVTDGMSQAIGQINTITGAANKSFAENNKGLVSMQSKLTQTSEKLSGLALKYTPMSLAAGAFVTKAVMGASDINEALNKTEVAFGKNADAIKKMSEGSAEKFGETRAQVLDTASTLGLLGVEASKVPGIMQRITDVGSLQNRSFKQVSDDFISAMNGSTEVVEKYGIKIKQVDLAQFMVEKGMASTTQEANKLMNSYSSTQKQMLIYEKIMSDTSNAEGDMAKNKDTIAVRTKIVRAQFEELASSIGATILPVVEDLVKWLSNVIKWFDALGDGPKKAIALFLVAIMALAPVLKALSITMTVINGVLKVYEAVTKAVTIVQWLLNAAMAANPVAVLVIAIVALIAIFALLMVYCEDFRETVIAIFQAIADFFSGLWEWVKEQFIAFITWMVEGWLDFQTSTQNCILAIQNFFSGLWTWLTNGWNTFVSWLLGIWNDFISTMQGVWGSITEGLNNFFTGAQSIFTNLVNWLRGIWGGFESWFHGLWEGVRDWIHDVYDWFTSPFLKAIDIIADRWNWLRNIAVQAITDIINAPGDAMNSVLNWLKDAINSIIKPINEHVISTINKIPFVNVGTIPMLAKGGVVAGPMNAIIGEAGPEAVIPLKKSVLASIGDAIVAAGGNNYTNNTSGITIGQVIINTDELDVDKFERILTQLSKEGGF